MRLPSNAVPPLLLTSPVFPVPLLRLPFSQSPKTLFSSLFEVSPLGKRSAWMIRRHVFYTSVLLCFIFNMSLSSSVFPSKWKVALVQPVYKQKGDHCYPLSYRPIALFPSVSNVFEQLVHRQYDDYWTTRWPTTAFQTRSIDFCPVGPLYGDFCQLLRGGSAQWIPASVSTRCS